MSRLPQTSLILGCIWSLVAGSPLFQGFSVQKGFSVEFKPFEFKPIAFIKEKWSPFGKFGVRKAIEKRDLSAVGKSPPLAPAPVFEPYFEDFKTVEFKKENGNEKKDVFFLPTQAKPVISNLINVPLTEKGTEKLLTNINRVPPISNYLIAAEQSAPVVVEEFYGELPPRPNEPIKEKEEVQEQEVVPLIKPPETPAPPSGPISEIPPTESPIVKGSRVALYFGNVLLQLVSQFLTNARLQFSQFPNVPPQQ